MEKVDNKLIEIEVIQRILDEVDRELEYEFRDLKRSMLLDKKKNFMYALKSRLESVKNIDNCITITKRRLV